MGKNFLAFFACVGVLLTPNIMTAEAFTLKNKNELNIIYKGETFIKKDVLGRASLSNAEFQSLGKTGEWDEVTILKGGSKNSCIFYREVGSKPGKIEITWYVKYAPYQFGTNFSGHSYNNPAVTYELKIPAEFLDGAQYKAVTGSPLNPSLQEGTLSGDQPEGKIIASRIRYIAFTKSNRSITLDLNPVGPHNGGDKCMLTESDWRLTRDGKYFSLWANIGKIAWGDSREFKIVVKEKGFEYENIHTSNKAGFDPVLRPTLELVFGNKDPKYRQLPECRLGDSSAYNQAKGYGWENSEAIQLVETDAESPLRRNYIKAAGKEKQSFVIDAQSGLYLVSVLFGSINEASGLFNVYANGRLKLANLKTEKGDFISKTTYAWAENGKLRLSFEGNNWMLNALSLTPLVYDEEDYLFKRQWHIQQDIFNEWFSNVEDMPPMPGIVRQTTSEDKMEWTWNCAFETLEASLDSTRTALDTPDSVEHRLRLIKSGGFNAAIINGLHMRYNFKDSIKNKIMLRNTRLAAETAHKMGIRLIDHFDWIWIYYPGYPSLLKMLDNDPDCLQRDVLNPLQVIGCFCLNSKAYMQELVDYLVNECKTTDIDGYMLDEIYWVLPRYCGCDKCRKSFYEDTGMQLPYEQDKGFFDDYNNDHGNYKIWREYVQWKGIKDAEFFGKVKKEVQKVCPHAVFLRYTSAPMSGIREGQEFNKAPLWNADYIGDEFHPDNMIQNWRVMFERFKDRQGIVSSWTNAPTWILPKFYDHHDQVLYAWAIARMSRGNVWYRAGDYPYSQKLNTWRHQMKDKYARPISDVAVLLSQYSINLRNNDAYYHKEYAAWIQTLAETSIQYDVIIDRDVVFDKLQKYAVLVLPNTAVLSDEEAGQIKDFVASGGSVIATYETGLFNEKGERRNRSVLQDVLNIKPSKHIPLKTKIVFPSELSKDMQQAELETDVMQGACQLIDNNKSRVLALARIIDPRENNGAFPAIVETAFGKGKFYYLSGNFISRNYEPRMASSLNPTFLTSAGQCPTYPVHFSKDLNVLAKNLLTLAIGERYKTKAEHIPEGLIYVAFNQKFEDQESILIHFLNCQGKPDHKYGDPLVDADRTIPQPPLPFDVKLKIKSNSKITEAFVVAPFKDGKTAIKIDCTDVNVYSVTVPKTAIENYAVLYLIKGR